MSSEGNFYSMSKLMECPELDAFMAQKNAGSRRGYFDLLDEFIETIPQVLPKLTAALKSLETGDFLKAIDYIQRRLLAIGATGLGWETEKIAEFARNRETKQCTEAAFSLATKLRNLCLKIQDARKVQPSSNSEDTLPRDIPVLEEVISKKENRIQSGISPEAFEKLLLLIENFELDEALDMLRSLLEYTYTSAINTALSAIYKHLSEFDYDNAYKKIDGIINMLRGEGQNEINKKKILAIDDVPDVLNIIKSVLRDRYAVYGVTNHKAALKFLTNNSTDLILLDIEMPDMNGFALLSIIRKIKAYEKTPVIFLTGNVSEENVKKSFEVGANDFVKKPIDAEILLGKIQKHL